MRMSQLFSQTRREAPAESDRVSYQLLVRAGYIHTLGSALYGMLPLGERAIQKLMACTQQELYALHAQEIHLPCIAPAQFWQGFAYPVSQINPSQAGSFVLSSDYEPVLLELVRNQIRSHKQLPLTLFQRGERWENAASAKAGLLNARQHQTLELFSLHATEEELSEQYEIVSQIFNRFFVMIKLPVFQVQSLPPEPEGGLAHEWLYLSPYGDRDIMVCANCQYMAVQEAAQFQRNTPVMEETKALIKVATPNCTSIESLANFLNIPASKTAKAVFLMASYAQANEPRHEELIFALVRGDRAVNETLLRKEIGAFALRPATNEEIRAVGAVPGYASPVGLKNITVIVDIEIPSSPNLVSGANEEGYHLLNVNFGRDFQAAKIARIASAEEGFACPQCGKSLHIERGFKLGHAIQSTAEYAQAHNATFSIGNGQSQPILIGRYMLTLSRTLACLAEEYHDGHGLIWPAPAAPLSVHMVVLPGKQSDAPEKTAQKIQAELLEAGYEPLVDDRNESPGVKFNDADLIGLPVRLTIGERGLKDGHIEFKPRSNTAAEMVPVEQIVNRVCDYLGSTGLPFNAAVGDE